MHWRLLVIVVKIDSKALIQQEFTAIKRVKEILGNAAPLIIDYIDALGEPGKEKGKTISDIWDELNIINYY